MIETDVARRVPLEPDELEYLINKKNEDIARQVKVFRISLIVILVVALLIGIGIFAITKLFPETFVNRHEAPPNALTTSLAFAIGLLSVIIIANVYSYMKTTRKLAKDIAEGKKTIEPCLIIRKFYAEQNGTYHIYITSTIKLSIEVTREEYARLDDDDKVYIEYSTYSKIFFGYSI